MSYDYNKEYSYFIDILKPNDLSKIPKNILENACIENYKNIKYIMKPYVNHKVKEKLESLNNNYLETNFLHEISNIFNYISEYSKDIEFEIEITSYSIYKNKHWYKNGKLIKKQDSNIVYNWNEIEEL